MNFIAKKVSNIKPSPTLAVVQKANELKARGHNILSLGAGEPDFDTPFNIKEAAIRAINTGFTKYTAVDGIIDLKVAIQKKFKIDNKLHYDLNQIMVSCGGKQVLYNCMQASINPGDEVIIPAPYWVSYPDMVALAGGIPVIVNYSAENNFKLTPEMLASKITKKTKWFIFNSPSNPTGVTYTEDEIVKLANVLREHKHVGIIADDIYEHIVFDDFRFRTFAQVAPDLQDRILTVNGVSKAYSMTGWRIGYCAGPVDLVKAMAKIQSQSTSNPCSISQRAALEALDGPQDFIKENANNFKQKRNLVISKIRDIEGLSCNIPSGAFYVFPSCMNLFGKKTPSGNELKDSNDVATYFLEEAKVAAVSGIAFGADGFFRVSYATSIEILTEAFDSIKLAITKLS